MVARKCVETVEAPIGHDPAVAPELTRRGFNLSTPAAPAPYPGDGDFHAFGDVQALAFGGTTAAEAVAAARKAGGGVPLPIFAAADATRVSTAAAAAVEDREQREA